MLPLHALLFLITVPSVMRAQSTPPPVQVVEDREVIQVEGDLPVMQTGTLQEGPLQIAEQMPEFPGGQEAMMKFISSNINYPEDMAEAGVGGKVFIEFVVRADGPITDVRVLRGIPGGPSLDREAVRVVKAMPKWNPGKQSGKPVDVIYRLPVMFKAQ
ncbi:MAG: energy transducer TonB [Flavobacteriales bacterium]